MCASWCFMGFCGVSQCAWRCVMVRHGASWCFMMLHGSHGVSWCFMAFHGASWLVMVLHGISWCSWCFMGFTGFVGLCVKPMKRLLVLHPTLGKLHRYNCTCSQKLLVTGDPHLPASKASGLFPVRAFGTHAAVKVSAVRYGRRPHHLGPCWRGGATRARHGFTRGNSLVVFVRFGSSGMVLSWLFFRSHTLFHWFFPPWDCQSTPFIQWDWSVGLPNPSFF